MLLSLQQKKKTSREYIEVFFFEKLKEVLI